MIGETAQRIQRIDKMNLSLDESLALLRSLTIDEFGELLMALPNERYTHLSRLLPANTSEEIQKEWTGSSGETLLKQSISFMNFVATNFTFFTGRDFIHARTLDFGCGWGRLTRLLPYFTGRQLIYGCDAWESSLNYARDARVIGTFKKSDVRPERLPFPNVEFDLIYSFSVFTHLPLDIATACLDAMRNSMSPNSLCIITIRPREYWAFASKARKQDYSFMEQEHDRKGYAFLPNSETNQDYGATSISFDFIRQNFQRWEIVRAGTTFADGMQTFVCLKPA